MSYEWKSFGSSIPVSAEMAALWNCMAANARYADPTIKREHFLSCARCQDRYAHRLTVEHRRAVVDRVIDR